MNPDDAPAMNYRAPGGPAADTVRLVCRRLADSGRLVAVSFSSWNPALDGDGRSQAVCLALVDVLAHGP